MSMKAMTAAFAVMLAMSAPAFAQSTIHANHLMPGQLRVTQMNGATVYDAQNRNIGDVKDIILDHDGRVSAVVLDVGSFLGMGGKFVALTMGDIKVAFDKNNKPRFTVDMSKEQLKSAQAYDLKANDLSTTGSSTAPLPERDTTAPR